MFTLDDGRLPNVPSQTSTRIGDIFFNAQGIQKELDRVNVNKSGGPDGIPNRIQHDFSSEIAPVLTYIYQQSYNTGTVPTDWSLAMVTPIFKSGHKSNPSNFRPVSLTCVCCKVMEHVVLCHLNRFLASSK